MSVRAFLVDCLRGNYQPRPPENVWQWGQGIGADGKVRIRLRSTESQDFAGPWSSDLNPYTRFMAEFVTGQFSENIKFLPGFEAAEWEEFIQKKSSQTGFTLTVLVIICYFVAVIRKNVIYSIDSTTEARRISKSRLQPMLRDCQDTAARISENEDDLANLTLNLLGLVIYLIGSFSEGAFANKSASLFVLDEADVHKKPMESMPETIGLARDRLKASGGGKLILLSKPATEADVTHREWKSGTQHKCFVPCPHCGTFQTLEWERVRFDHCKDLAGDYDLERVKRETFLECEFCRGRIEDRHKPEMLARHEWRQTNPKPFPGKISAEISDLYSPFEKATFGVLALEWIEAQTNLPNFIKFWQSRLGRAWRLQASSRTATDILNLCAPYPRGTCPVKPELLAVAADTQDHLRKWVKGAFDRRKDLYILDWGVTNSFEELEDVRLTPVPIKVPLGWTPEQPWEGLETAVADVGIIDEGGHLGDDVRRFCLRYSGVWYPSKGRGRFQIRATVHQSEGEVDGVKIPVYHFHDAQIKKLFYIQRIGKAAETRAHDEGKPVRPGAPRIPTIYLPAEIDSELIDELVSERLTKKKGKYGFIEEKWEKNASLPNDWGDAAKNLLVLWYVLEPLIFEMLRQLEEAEARAGKAFDTAAAT